VPTRQAGRRLREALAEFAARGIETDEAYRFGLGPEREATDEFPLVVDWAPMVAGILADAEQKLPAGVISAKFHNTLAEIIVAVARRFGQAQVALTGGCFQNCRLLERTVARLEAGPIAVARLDTATRRAPLTTAAAAIGHPRARAVVAATGRLQALASTAAAVTCTVR